MMLASDSLEVWFDPQTGEMISLLNRAAGTELELSPTSAFRIEFEDGALEAADCQRTLVETGEGRVQTVYRGQQYEVVITHSLQATPPLPSAQAGPAAATRPTLPHPAHRLADGGPDGRGRGADRGREREAGDAPGAVLCGGELSASDGMAGGNAGGEDDAAARYHRPGDRAVSSAGGGGEDAAGADVRLAGAVG